MTDFDARTGRVTLRMGEFRRLGPMYREEINRILREGKRNKYELGKALKLMWENCADDICLEAGKYSFSPKYFFRLVEDWFSLDKSEVSRLIHVVEEFGDSEIDDFALKWQPYSYAALVEMLPMTPTQRARIPPDWSRARIREFKATLVDDTMRSSDRELLRRRNKPVENSEDDSEIDGEADIFPEESEIPSMVREYPTFRFYMAQSREKLVERIVQLEIEQKELFRILSENGVQI